MIVGVNAHLSTAESAPPLPLFCYHHVDFDNDNDSDALSLAERSSAASLVALSDVELPDGLIAYHSDSDVPSGAEDAEEDEEWGGFDADAGSAKRKRKLGNAKTKDKGGKKRRLRALPTFATYDDYAALIEGAPEDNI